MNKEKRWYFAFLLVFAVAITGLFWDSKAPEPKPGEFLTADAINFGNTAWILTASCLVLLMTPGLAFFYGGMVSKKNVISTMLKSFICMGLVSLIWVTVGFSLAFGDSVGITIDGVEYGLFGNPFQYTFFNNVGSIPNAKLGSSIPFIIFALFQMKFAIITPAIITGALAERIRFISFLIFVSLFVIFIYAPLCHMVWHPSGLLTAYFGIKDFAGGTVVHMSAGFAALAGVLVLGKRQNKLHIPTNIPFVILGTGLLWFGWFGFNSGSALAADGLASMAFGTTIIASATAMLTWVFFDRINGRPVSSIGACIGAVVGLVVVTPAAGFITIPESMFFGFVGALVSNLMMYWERLKRIDDTLDVFACHGIGGISGMLLTAVFASTGAKDEKTSLLHGGFEVFSHHLVAFVIVSVFTFGSAYLLFYITNKVIPIRVTEENEILGLDISQHGEQF